MDRSVVSSLIWFQSQQDTRVLQIMWTSDDLVVLVITHKERSVARAEGGFDLNIILQVSTSSLVWPREIPLVDECVGENTGPVVVRDVGCLPARPRQHP